MEENEDEPEDVRLATPVEDEIIKAEEEAPASGNSKLKKNRVKDDTKKKKKEDEDEDCCTKKERMKKEKVPKWGTIHIFEEECKLPKPNIIPRHCLSKKEHLDMLATPSRKCESQCLKKPVTRKLKVIPPRIAELARPLTRRILRNIEDRGDTIAPELLDNLIKMIEAESSLNPEQAAQLFRDKKSRSKKECKKKRGKIICDSKKAKEKRKEDGDYPLFDPEAVCCQYLMAEQFVKSILDWKCPIPKEEIKDISEVILKRLSFILEYTPIDNGDRKSQQMRFLADVISCWISGVLHEVAEAHRQELEEECERRKQQEEEETEEEEESEDETLSAKSDVDESEEDEDQDEDKSGKKDEDKEDKEDQDKKPDTESEAQTEEEKDVVEEGEVGGEEMPDGKADEEEAERKRAEEEEAERQRLEEAEAERNKAEEEEARRKLEEEENERKRAEEEALAEARRLEDEAKQKEIEEAERVRMEEEAKQKEIEEAERVRMEEEARQKEIEEAERVRMEEEAKQKEIEEEAIKVSEEGKVTEEEKIQEVEKSAPIKEIDQTKPTDDELLSKTMAFIPAETEPLIKGFQPDLPFVTFNQIFKTIYSMIEKEEENTGEDPIVNRLHRSVYERFYNAVLTENPVLLTDNVKDMIDVVTGKIAIWLSKVLTESEMLLLEKYPPEVESKEVRDWANLMKFTTQTAADWTTWLQNRIKEARQMQPGRVTRGQYEEWTRNYHKNAVLLRQFHLDTVHKAHHNAMMIKDREVVRTGKKKTSSEYPEEELKVVNLDR